MSDRDVIFGLHGGFTVVGRVCQDSFDQVDEALRMGEDRWIIVQGDDGESRFRVRDIVTVQIPRCGRAGL